MRLPIYQVDAFTNRMFGGNPAAVCPLDHWLPDEQMQAIAMENNLSETAFIVPEGDGYRIRWFTPTIEVDLCGHATLATAYVVHRCLEPGDRTIAFQSMSGPLAVRCEGDWYTLDFPARPGRVCEAPTAMVQALGRQPREVRKAVKYLAVFDTAADVAALQPDMDLVQSLDADGLIVTAPGTDVDFVSRYFAPHAGIPEDPVTGSAHCTLTPYWAERLDRTTLTARQISRRGGELRCELAGDRILISGQAVLYLEGSITLP
jgi:predicted PhzF superfamily epimerase YddE/YHI9